MLYFKHGKAMLIKERQIGIGQMTVTGDLLR